MRARRVDENQSRIVDALRRVGMSVQVTSAVGEGFPDLVVGWKREIRGVSLPTNLLMEVKDGSRPPSERRLTDAQEVWHREWRGQVVVVKTIAEALAAVGVCLP